MSESKQGSGMFGSAVALSNDGDTAVIGGDIDNNKVGAVWVFSGLGGMWMLGGAKLTASDEIGQGQFGTSVSLSGDGRTALIGAPFDNGVFPDGIGAGFVFASGIPTPTPTPTPTRTPTPIPIPTPTPTVTLKLSGLKSGAVKLDKRLTAKGTVTPTSLAGSMVTCTVQKKQGSKWVKVKRVARTVSASGACSWQYKPAKRGTYRLQVTIAKTATHGAATTKWLSFRVK
jgi:FG-GAP repeat